jgi:succinoglycan biosynthesis protein ExoA
VRDSTSQGHRPLVSVIIPVLNEAPRIEQVIGSILGQSRPTYDLEILVVDGNSTDGTSEILRSIAVSNPELRLLTNARRVTPVAFNIGLEQARGEYICILGAHTVYDQDYIFTCLNELAPNDAVGCGGRVFATAANTSMQARLVALSLSSSFGTSSKSFRNHPQGYADTINYPVYYRRAVMEVGGYDEELWRNQDNDLNQRLRSRGHRLYMTWKTSCRYFVQPTIGSLSRYAWKNGYWNVISLRKNAAAHGFYHFIPGIFVLACVLTSLVAFLGLYLPIPWASVPLIVLLSSYVSVSLIASCLAMARQSWLRAALLPPFFLALHVSYGLGTLWGVMCNAKSPETGVADATRRKSSPAQSTP